MSIYKRSLVALTLAAMTISGWSFKASAQDFEQVDESNGSLSKLIRSNTRHYWNAMRASKYQTPMKKYLAYTGIVSGDPHYGNFSVIPLEDVKGKESLEWANIDFDDAGVAPFALDFARLVVAAKAIEYDQAHDKERFPGAHEKMKAYSDGTVRQMVEAYVDGLNGRKLTPPPPVAKVLSKGIEKYRKEVAELVDKRTNKENKIKLTPGEVVGPGTKLGPVRADLERLFASQGNQILDLARVLKDRGGSAGSLRLLVLVKDSKNTLSLYDIKEWKETSLTSYQPQKPVGPWLADLHPVFWPGKSPSTYTLVKLAGKNFWIREKRKSILDVPYDAKSEEDLIFLKDLGAYVANTLGLIHGRQASARPLAALLSRSANLEEFRQAVKSVQSLYRDEALATLQ
jgi:hypothetical protein